MGNAASAAGEGTGGGPLVPQGDEDHCGYRVLGVQAGSPAASAGLVSFFDFIVMANHIPLRVRTYTDTLTAACATLGLCIARQHYW